MSRSASYTSRQKSPESHAKSEVISKFLVTWARIVGKARPELAYADLYAGNGYHDPTGEKGTALECIDAICRDKALHSRLRMYLNEGRRQSADQLHEALKGYARTSCLQGWSVTSEKVATPLYDRYIKLTNGRPTFWFLDPTGWAGLSKRGIVTLTEENYSDLVFFLSLTSIRRFLNHTDTQQSLKEAFGEEALAEVQAGIGSCDTAQEREALIVSTLHSAYMDQGRYSECMRFGRSDQDGVSHYLVFVTKHPRGRRSFMSIVQAVSNWHSFGVPIAGFRTNRETAQLSLFDDSGIERKVADLVWDQFASRAVKVDTVLDEFFSPHVSLTEKMMKTVLKSMEGTTLTVDIPASKRRLNASGEITLGNDRLLTFRDKDKSDG